MDAVKRRYPWVIFATAAIVRLAGIARADYWYDEAFTALIVRQGARTALLALGGDVHPPLYYALLWLWVRLVGAEITHEMALRFPSAVLSLLSLGLTLELGRLWGVGSRRLWWLVGLLAISPAQVHYAQEARMYMLLEVLYLLMLVAYERRWAVRLAVFAGAALWTHYYAAFVVAGLALIALLERRSWWPFAAAGMSFAPWLAVLMAQMRIIHGHYWIQDLDAGEMFRTLEVAWFGWSAHPAMHVLNSAWTVGVIAWGLWRHPHRRWLLLFTPMALAALVSVAWQPVWLPRAFVPLAPVALLLVGHRLRGREGMIVGGAWACLSLVTLGWFFSHPPKGPFTTLDRFPDDARVVYHMDDSTLLGFSVYASHLENYKMPTCADPPGALSPITRFALFGPPRAPTAGAWVVHTHFPLTPDCEVREAVQLERRAVQTVLLDEGHHGLTWAKAYKLEAIP